MRSSTTAALLEKPSRMTLAPLGHVLGAEVTGVDVARPVPAPRIAELERALLDYKLLCIRDQLLSTDALLDFTALLGTPGEHALPGRADDERMLVAIASNADERGRPNGRAGDPATLVWRADRPSASRAMAATLLYGVEVPSRGGEMLFCDAAAAYDALPERTRRMVDPLPLARRHPVSGRRAIDARPDKGVDGNGDAQHAALHDSLLEFATQSRFVYRHAWRRHDLLVWDNRCTLHRATPFDGTRDVLTTYCTMVAGARLG